jgi:hypothetical protein
MNPNPSTETELLWHRKTVGSVWDGANRYYGLGPVIIINDERSDDNYYDLAELSKSWWLRRRQRRQKKKKRGRAAHKMETEWYMMM